MKKLLILFFMLIAAQVFAIIRTVPDQYSTIQSALNACDAGDTVLVNPGIYHENIVWPQQDNIHLRAASLRQPSIIDGNAIGRVIDVEPNGKGLLHADLQGLTIRN